jgi:membrane associated rhomboid family serine protease
MAGESLASLGLVRPGRALIAVMVALSAIWLMFAIAINWGGASEDVFLLFCGNTELIVRGQVWRLFTAPLMHLPSGTIGHILWSVLGLLFLAPTLEQRWGPARLLRFLFLSSIIAYGFQMLFEIAVPASIGKRLSGDYWFGAVPVLEAVAVAWALNFRGQTVRLFGLVPVTSTTMLLFIVAMSVLRVVAASPGPEGLVSPFGGMVAGWLLGGGTPSPLRRAYLRLRLAQLDREASRNVRTSTSGKKDGPLRVIEGGRGRGSPGGNGGDGSGGRMLH